MKFTIKIFVAYIVAFIFSNFIYAQNVGSWNILYLKYDFSERWNFFLESQLRSLKMYDNFHYYEYKGGFNYSLDKNIKFTVGIGSYQTYKEGGNFKLPKNNDEIRIWPQIILLQSTGMLKIEHRYRGELRFTSNGYRNRFRYRMGLFYQFGKEDEQEKYKPFQISLTNEIFFSNIEPYFERNRLQLAINYKLLPFASIQIGYLYQFDYKIFDEIGKDFIQLGFYFEFKNKQIKPLIELDIKDN
jgi:hypothetical protein